MTKVRRPKTQIKREISGFVPDVEKLYEDEIQLVNKLLQICSKNRTKVGLWNVADLAKPDPDRAGFDHRETFNFLLEARVVKEVRPPIKLSPITVEVDLAKLQRRAEGLHDEIESRGSKMMLGIERQKRKLLRHLTDRFDKYPDQEIFTYSEKLLGPYRPSKPDKPLGDGLLQPDDNRPDIEYQFMRVMRELEKEGYFSIEDVEIDFDVQPKPTERAVEEARWAIGTEHQPREFYPAEHCKVTLKVDRQKEKESLRPSYNPTTYTLFFRGKEVSIPADSNQHTLCKVLFKSSKSMKKVWNWDEMLEEWGDKYVGAYKKEDWRKVYNAGREVNTRAATETQVSNLLIVKPKTITVNPKHLS